MHDLPPPYSRKIGNSTEAVEYHMVSAFHQLHCLVRKFFFPNCKASQKPGKEKREREREN
jgi:hypothetical protein